MEDGVEQAPETEKPLTPEEAFKQRLTPQADVVETPAEEVPEEELADEEEDLEYEEVLEDESDEDPVFTIRASGEEHSLTLEQLQQEASKGIDYTRKTQALALEREKVAQQLADLQALQQSMANLAQQDVIEVNDPGEEYWQDLQVKDPVRYLIERDQFRERKAAALEQERQREQALQGYQQQMLAQQQSALQQEQSTLIQARPEWSDPSTFQQAKADMREAGLRLGYDENELSQITDHRAVLALAKVAEYDRMMAKSSDIKAAPQKTATARHQAKRRRSSLQKAKQQLAQSGKPRDAQAAFKALLKRK